MWEDPREPSGRPGFRSPHATVGNGGRSTLDLFGKNFVLLAGSSASAWCAAAEAAGRSLGVPVDTSGIGADLDDSSGVIAELHGTGPDGAVLVRPDGFVAWRASEADDDAEGVLERALGAALGKPRPG
jgi:hypothetical protein